MDGLSRPDQIAKRCSELGMSACALTDHGSISGATDFVTQCKKQNIKSILGCEFYVTEDDSTLKDRDNIVTHQVILAKNLKGWYKLIELISKSNDKDRFYYKPRIDLEIMKEICNDDLISFSGHLGSTIHLRSGSMDDMENYVRLMQDIFGKENFFLEVQLIDSENNKEMKILGEKVRELGKKINVPCVATGDAHYVKQEDAVDHRVLLCSSLQTTLRDVRKQLEDGTAMFSGFFKGKNFHLPSYDDVVKCGNTEEEISNTELIANMCDDYDITGPPKLPKFSCPNDLTEDEYLRILCREGWKNKNKNWDKQQYGDRVKKELEVIKEASLAGYFLIVQDYVKWAKNEGWLIGPGRGSAAGSLIAYLLDITNVDPIKYGLIFERFYNKGRNTADRVSLPDIDIDFPVTKRKLVIDYLKNKYGNDRVCQVATFGRMQGRAALKEVLRVNNACDYETMNEITRNIPQEAEISDQLEVAGESSIIQWTIDHDFKRISEYYGDYETYFKQAIRLEGTYKSQGKHAAGVVLSAEPLDKVCPMINDKNSSEKMAGMSMEALASMGHVKFDILGVAALDKLMAVNNLLQFGKVNP